MTTPRINASLFVNATSTIAAGDRPHPNANGSDWRIITLAIGDLTLHIGGDTDEETAANLNRLIKPLQDLRNAAAQRLVDRDIAASPTRGGGYIEGNKVAWTHGPEANQ